MTGSSGRGSAGLLAWVVPKARGDRRWSVGDCQRVGKGQGLGARAFRALRGFGGTGPYSGHGHLTMGIWSNGVVQALGRSQGVRGWGSRA